MKIVIDIPFQKWMFIARQYVTGLKVKRVIRKHRLDIKQDEQEGLVQSLTQFPEFDVEKVVTGYVSGGQRDFERKLQFNLSERIG